MCQERIGTHLDIAMVYTCGHTYSFRSLDQNTNVCLTVNTMQCIISLPMVPKDYDDPRPSHPPAPNTRAGRLLPQGLWHRALRIQLGACTLEGLSRPGQTGQHARAQARVQSDQA